MAEESSLSSPSFNYIITAKLGTPKEKKQGSHRLICPTTALLASLQNKYPTLCGSGYFKVATALSLAAVYKHADVYHTRVTCFQSCTWMRLLGLQIS